MSQFLYFCAHEQPHQNLCYIYNQNATIISDFIPFRKTMDTLTLHIIKTYNCLYWRARSAQRGLGKANIFFTFIFACLGPIAIAYFGLYMVPLISMLLMLFLMKDTRIGKHSTDIQHLLPMLHDGGVHKLAKTLFVLDLRDICTLTLLPTLIALGIAQPKLIAIALCMAFINSTSSTYLILQSRRKRKWQFLSTFAYMFVCIGALNMARHLLEHYAQLDRFVLGHWILLSLLAMPCAAFAYYVVIHGIKRIIIDHPFHSPEVVEKNTKPIKI